METKKRRQIISRGEILGAIVGYLLSYFLQSSYVQAKLGFGGYIVHIWDILKSIVDKQGGFEVAMTAWVSIIVGAVLGAIIENVLVKKGIIEPWPRKKNEPGASTD